MMGLVPTGVHTATANVKTKGVVTQVVAQAIDK